MQDFLAYTVLGLCLGSVYAIAATGLVVTYSTSGVFNFAHGAVATTSALIFWQLRFDWDVPAPIAIEHTWTGFVSKSWNAEPVFGEIATNVYSACVQNGVGLARGTYQGELCADLIAGDRHELVRDMLAHGRPSPLPPEPLTTWGARARIAWAEFLSRRER